MKHNVNLQLLRGAATTFVFMTHFMFVERHVKGHPGLFSDWAYLGSMSVDLFFVISGFIMVTIAAGRFGVPNEWKRFAVERVVRIYPAYWAVSLPILVLYLAKPELVNSSQGHRVDLIASFLLLPEPLLPLLAVGWTLVHEVYFYAVFTLLLAWLPARRLPQALAAWALGVVLVERTLAGHGSAWVDLVSNPMTLDFIAGCVAALVWRRCSPRIACAALAVALVWLAVALRMIPIDLDSLFFEPWARVALGAVPCALVTLALVRLDPGQPGRLRAAGAWVGDRSYSFYLVHLLVLSALGKAWALAPADGLWDNGAILVAGYAICLVCAACGYAWLERPPMRAVKRWMSTHLRTPSKPSDPVPLASQPRTMP